MGSRFLSRLVLGGFAALSAALLLPAAALASISGPCQGSAQSSSGSSVDLKTASVWHVKNDDTLSGTGSADSPQTQGAAYAVAFGVPVYTIASGNGKGSSGSGSIKVANFTKYTRTIGVSGSSDSCSGSIEIIVDDVSPLGTIAGMAGVAMAAVGVLGVLGLMFAGGGCASRIVGLILGLLAGAGIGLTAIEEALLDPRSLVGLGIVGVAGILGAVLPGLFHRGGGATTPA